MRVRALATTVLTGFALSVAVPATGGAAPGNTACEASEREIYSVPDRIDENPGEVIACRVTALPYALGAPPLTAYTVKYATTDAKGAKVAATGTVAVPTAAWTGAGERPSVAFAPLSHGSGSACAMSKQLDNGLYDQFEIFTLNDYLSNGWIVTVPDGVGYLDGQTHHYVNGRSNGHALLDLVHASRRLPADALTVEGPVAITGYSAGGNTALWAAQLASTYAPELNVVGASAGGIPGDLKALAAHLDGSLYAGLLVSAAVGLHDQYPEMPFTELLSETGRRATARATSNCLLGTLATLAFTRVEDLMVDHLSLEEIYDLTGPDQTSWGEVFDELRLGDGVGTPNSPARYPIGFPVLQYRGALEDLVPAASEDDLAETYCRSGVATRYEPTVIGNHILAFVTGAAMVEAFISDRFAGKPFTPSRCRG